MILNLDTGTDPRLHLWTREEYYKMAEQGFFDHRRVELIAGHVIEMSPMNEPHAIGLGLTADVLRGIFYPRYHVREQLPFLINSTTELEPDIAVVVGSRREYLQTHPSQAVLIVEVSESTLAFDRSVKCKIYAQAGIPEYWIVNLIDRQLEVYQDPIAGEYKSINVYPVGQQVNSLHIPDVYISIADLIP